MVFTLPGMMVRCTVPSFLSPPSDIWPPPPLFHPAPPPLAGIPFKSTITAYRNTDIPVTGGTTIRSPISAPTSSPSGKEGHLLFPPASSAFFFLILLPFCCTLSARRPASFLRPSTTEQIRLARLRALQLYTAFLST